MHQGRKDTMLMDMKNMQQFNTDGISANEQYLGYEQRMHRWIQIPTEEAAFMKEKGEVAKKGFRIQLWQYC